MGTQKKNVANQLVDILIGEEPSGTVTHSKITRIASDPKSLQAKIQDLTQENQNLLAQVESHSRKAQELEGRVEIVRLEQKAVVKHKDDMILHLKRQVTRLLNEVEAEKRLAEDMKVMAKEKDERLTETLKILKGTVSDVEVALKGPKKDNA